MKDYSRRDILKAGAGLSIAPSFIGPFGSDDSVFTPLASEHVAILGRDLSDVVPTFGANDYLEWAVTYDPEKAEGVRGFAEDRNDARIVADPGTMDKLVVQASTDTIGITRTAKIRGNGLAAVDGVERIDLVLSMTPPKPVESLAEDEYKVPRGLLRRYDYSLDGVAFDAETTTIGTARQTLAVDKTNVSVSGTETVKVGVIDTGCNVANGHVFGRGQRNSPIRIPKAANFSDGASGEEADVTRGHVEVTHESIDDFQEGTHNGTVSLGSTQDGYVALDLAAYSWTVNTQTEFQNGTLTSVEASSSDTLELASSTQTVYVNSGQYLSVWHDFGASTTFSTNTTTQTANGGTITYEYRSSSDGTDGTASSWYTDLTNVPENQFLQVRITLEPSSDDQTPTVDSFDIDGEFIVDTQTDWDAGSYTDTTASNGILELGTTDQTVYDTSGTYVSEYHEFAEVARFTSASTTETLNGQTVTYEYRSSSDGTDGTASSWQTDITAVPDAQYIQVRITLETTDDTTTPTVSEYTTNAEQQAGTYVSQSFFMDNADRSTVDLELTDAEATVTVEAEDADGNWNEVANTTVTTTTVEELTIDAGDGIREFRHRVRLEPTIEPTENAVAQLQAESIESPEQILNNKSDWSPVADGDGHGTWCASAIAGDPTDANYRGIAADAPVDLYIAKALNDDGSGSTKSIIEAIDWMSQQGVDVINLSLGSQFYNESIDDALQSFLENGGSAAVIAAGNDRQVSRFINSPGDSANVITVTATTNKPPSEAQIGHFPNVGPDDGLRDLSEGETAGRMPDVGAPGISLEAETPLETGTTQLRTLTGTSMAAPTVAGIVALLLADDPSLKGDHEAVRERLKKTAAPIPKAGETEVGAGMPQADALLANEESDTEQADELTTGAEARDAGNCALSGSFVRRFL